MSNLGGTKMSEDTDKNNQALVESVVAGTNVTVTGTATDPTVNADTQLKNTTKGDLEVFTTVAARLAVGSNAQVLTADSAEASGMKWAAASGGASAAIQAVSPGTGFGMLGLQASAIGSQASSTITKSRANIDMIYFDGVTTVTELNFWSISAPTADINVYVGLHSMDDRGNIGNQEEVDIIVTVATGTTLQSKVLGTPWTPTEGWHFLVTWVKTTNLTGVMVNLCNGQGGFMGQSISAYGMTNATNDGVEHGCFVVIDSDYDTAPNTRLTASDLNDASSDYAFVDTNGNIHLTSNVPFTILKAG